MRDLLTQRRADSGRLALSHEKPTPSSHHANPVFVAHNKLALPLGALPPGFRTRCISENTSAAGAGDVGLRIGSNLQVMWHGRPFCVLQAPHKSARARRM